MNEETNILIFGGMIWLLLILLWIIIAAITEKKWRKLANEE
jgi:hypothetical protein